jgi:fibro-slime domain-containing protein
LTKSLDANGNTVYESTSFFPIDDVPTAEPGFKDGGGVEHNFHFTFELNTTFVYKGGEVFSFSGDDDLWVFINDQLVVDVGGVHPPAYADVNLDSLGLTAGQQYPLSVFHAERHTGASNFKITTSIQFTNCKPILR